MRSVRLLLQHGANPRARDPRGVSPLDSAMRGWYQERALATQIIELLLQWGADIDEVVALNTSEKDTRLSEAVGQGNDELVRFLLAHGAHAKAQNSVALRAATKRGDPQMLALMTSKGGNPSAALPDAVIFSFQPAARRTVTQLLALGADPNTCDFSPMRDGNCTQRGRPLLAIALERGDIALAQELADHGAKSNAVARSGETILGSMLTRQAARKGDQKDKFDRLAAVQFLLKMGANPNLPSENILPLSLVDDQDVELMKALLDRGARSESRTLPNGEVLGPITVATLGRPRLAEELVSRTRGRLGPTERHALRIAAATGNVAVARKLIAAGAECNATGPLGETPLHLAAQHAGADMIALLAGCGGDPNARAAATARIYLSQMPGPFNDRVYDALPPPGLADGAQTPLMLAAMRDAGGPQAVRALLDAGADRSLRSEHGRTAADFARDWSNHEVAAELAGR
jgi:uncharacterized protein